MNKYIEFFLEEYKKFDEVDAICLGGSRARSGNLNDDASDYDVYVYLNRPLLLEKRKKVLEQISSHMEINNEFFELEDDVILKDNIPLELIYRTIEDFDKTISNVMVDYKANFGYSTCFVDNMFNSIILYEKESKYTNFRNKYDKTYPTKLMKNIVKLNRDYLSGTMASFDKQIVKAYKRNDLVSINHRTAEFVKCYFDILFALNKTYHIGEKRLLSYATQNFTHLPVDFEKDMVNLLKGTAEISKLLNNMVFKLDELIKEVFHGEM